MTAKKVFQPEWYAAQAALRKQRAEKSTETKPIRSIGTDAKSIGVSFIRKRGKV